LYAPNIGWKGEGEAIDIYCVLLRKLHSWALGTIWTHKAESYYYTSQKTPLPVPRITKIKTIVCHLNYSAKTNIKLGISANLIVKEFTEYFKPFASLVGGTEYWCKSSNFMSRRGSCLGISQWIWTWEVRMISFINNQDSLCNHVILLGQRRKTHQPVLYDNWNPIEIWKEYLIINVVWNCKTKVQHQCSIWKLSISYKYLKQKMHEIAN
jgi:hypothetical protein